MTADGNPVGILFKVINHRLCAAKSFLTIRNPFLIIAGINQFFERIIVTVFFGNSMKLYADADTTMKKEAIDRATSDINLLYSTEYDIKWKDDEELLKRLYCIK